MALDYFTLISSTPDAPYRFSKSISIYPPTLDDIRKIGYNVYQSYINILAGSKEDFLEGFGAKIPEFKGDTLVFLTTFPLFRDILIEALSFFLRREIRYDEKYGYLLEDDSVLEFDEIREIKRIILQLSYIDVKDEPGKLKYKNAKAKKIYERIQALKAEQAKRNKKKADPDMELANLIGAVCAFSPSYNLTNIWQLTIFQFYDQYIRLNTKVYIDISGVRWAAWGKEDFQWDLWHKAVNSRKREQ